MILEFVKLTKTALSPKFAHDGDACFDLCADIKEPVTINPGSTVEIGTGLAFNTPAGWKIMLYSRSGHGFKHNVRLANCTGVVDATYRGEVIVALRNEHPFYAYTVHPGDRIAQGSLDRVEPVMMVESKTLIASERGTNGFGSTGVQ